MNLLYTSTAYPPSHGGAQSLIHQVARQLLNRHRIQVVSYWDSNRTDWLLGTTIRVPSISRDYVIDEVSVHLLGLSRRDKMRIAPFMLVYYPLMRLALPKISACIKELLHPYATQADLVHNVRIGREGLSYASFQVARQHGIPFVLTTVHHPRWVGWRYRAYIKLYTLADAVIALSEGEKQLLMMSGVPEERITVTGVGPTIAAQVHPEKFLRDWQIDGPMILFLAQHYRYKGYRQVLQAVRSVWQKVPEAHFVFMGAAVGQSEREFVAYQDRRIHRLVKPTLQEKTDALAACTLLCVPSTQESFGASYTEAWSFGKPVIGCNIPTVASVIADGIDGYLVKQTPDQIAERICDLLLHPTQAQQMGAAGRRKVETKYTWSQIAERTERAYQKALGSSSMCNGRGS